MMTGFAEFADSVSSLPDINSVWHHLGRFAGERGFSNCSLTLAARTKDGIHSTRLLSDLPREFREMYQHGGLIGQDPFLLFCCGTLSPKKVTTENLTDYAGASREHQAFLDFTADSGAKNGLGVPVRTVGSEPFGGWLFTSRETARSFSLLEAEHATETHLAGVLAYERIVAIDARSPAHWPGLSSRERECLRWLGAGLRTAAIAEKLGISPSAVNLYISNSKRKMQAKTREQAVAMAIISGEIAL